MKTRFFRLLLLILVLCLVSWGRFGLSAEANLQLTLPLQRVAHQTNELIDVSVIRTSAEGLRKGPLLLTLDGADGSTIELSFPVGAVPAEGGEATSVEHLRLNGWLLRPGKYMLHGKCDGAAASVSIEIYSHVRRSTFRTIDWRTSIKPDELWGMGEQCLGFNLLFGATNNGDMAIRAGLDFMQGCAMGGGHNLDLRRECDWSDHYVVQAAAARVTRQALTDRTAPNTVGVHFYDEQELISYEHPETGERTPHNVPGHERTFRNVLGIDPPRYFEVDSKNPDDVASWLNWGRRKQLLIESAWKKSAFGVHRVQPDLIAVNQSVWAWDAWTRGHYFNEARSLDAISGHGKYSWANLVGYYYPTMSWEFGRVRDLKKDTWHLPSWYSKRGNLYRMEQYMSFQLHLTGMAKPPWLHVHRPRGFDPDDQWCSIQRLFPDVTDGVVESNKRMARLGTIFTTMPVHRPKAAVLYSLSTSLHRQAGNMKDHRNSSHLDGLRNLYLAGKMANINLFPVVEEDVSDGTLAAHHKAVVLAAVTYLEPEVIASLEGFIDGGGVVLATDDSTVKIRGARQMGVSANLEETPSSIPEAYAKLAEPLRRSSVLVEPLRRHLAQAGIEPVFECDNPEIFASRQGVGEIEYLFATNASWDAGVAEPTSIRPATATITVPADGRPIYDAILTCPAREFARDGDNLRAALRFGPGQMRVYARTARPIGGVQTLSAVVQRDYLAPKNPVRLDLAAALMDADGRLLAGSAPMQIVVTDPLGHTRYDLYRATEHGVIKLSLPLAANDPAGRWTVTVRELLSGTQDSASFAFEPPSQCGALAGAVDKAILFGEDTEKIFSFFSTYEDVSIVAGSSDYSQAAARRLSEMLASLDIRCATVPLEEAATPRALTDEEAATWCGLEYIGSGGIKPGNANSPKHVGFNVRGPVVLVGNPQDNPLIEFASANGFLPYKPDKASFPSPRRGYLAWQRDAVSYGQESVTVIAYDSDGMAEAAGTLYEAAAGITPLMARRPPAGAAVRPAETEAKPLPSASVRWEFVLPDRVSCSAKLPGGDLLVLSQDGTFLRLQPGGEVVWRQTIDGGQYWFLSMSADGNTVAVGATQQVIVFDGEGRRKFGKQISEGGPKSARIAGVAVSPDGQRIFVSAANHLFDGFPQCADNRPWYSMMLNADGEEVWRTGDMLQKDGTPASIYRSAAFTADGSRLVAINRTDYFNCEAKKPGDFEADIIDAANGKVLGTVDKVNAWLGITPVDGKFMMLDGDRTVTFVSAEEAKVVSQATFPERGVVEAVPFGKGIVAGCEVGGHVWAVSATSGKAEDNLVWHHSEPSLIVKKIVTDGNRTAVAYWGGTLKVFDSKGSVVASHRFGQDIVGLEWSNGILVAADADGRIAGLTVK